MEPLFSGCNSNTARFEVLHAVGLAIQVTLLLELLGNGVALLRQPAVLLPIRQELPTTVLPVASNLRALSVLLSAGAPLGYSACKGSCPG